MDFVLTIVITWLLFMIAMVILFFLYVKVDCRNVDKNPEPDNYDQILEQESNKRQIK
jgi:hypothetical protein